MPSKHSTSELEKNVAREKLQGSGLCHHHSVLAWFLPPPSRVGITVPFFSCSLLILVLLSEMRLCSISFCWSSQSSRMRTCRAPTPTSIHDAASRPRSSFTCWPYIPTMETPNLCTRFAGFRTSIHRYCGLSTLTASSFLVHNLRHLKLLPSSSKHIPVKMRSSSVLICLLLGFVERNCAYLDL